MNADKLLHNFDEAREIMGGVPRTTFHLWISQGLIRPVKIGRKPYFRHEDLLALIEAHVQKAK